MNYADVGVIHAATQITAFPALLVLARQYQTTLWTCYSKESNWSAWSSDLALTESIFHIMKEKISQRRLQIVENIFHHSSACR